MDLTKNYNSAEASLLLPSVHPPCQFSSFSIAEAAACIEADILRRIDALRDPQGSLRDQARYREPTDPFRAAILEINHSQCCLLGQFASRDWRVIEDEGGSMEPYFRLLDSAVLRYYIASRMIANPGDIYLEAGAMIDLYNAEVVKVYARLLEAFSEQVVNVFGSKLPQITIVVDSLNIARAFDSAREFEDSYRSGNLGEGMPHLLEIAEEVLFSLESLESLQETDVASLAAQNSDAAQKKISDAAARIIFIAAWLSPIWPAYAASVKELFHLDFLPTPLLSSPTMIFPLQIIIQPGTKRMVAKLLPDEIGPMVLRTEGKHPTPSGCITLSDLAGADLRLVRITEAEKIKEAPALIRLVFDLGSDRPRQCIARIGLSYTEEELSGKIVAAVVNMEPLHMKYGMSEAMLLATGTGKNITLIIPEREALPGSKLY